MRKEFYLVLHSFPSQNFKILYAYLANALAKCRHSALIGHALQFGLLFVQKTCIHCNSCLNHDGFQLSRVGQSHKKMRLTFPNVIIW